MDGRPALRPLAIGEIVDAAISLYRAHPAPLLRIVVWVIVPIQVIGFIVGISTIDNADQLFGSGIDSGSSRRPTDVTTGDLIGNIAISVLGGFAQLLTIAACFRAASDAYLGGEPDAGQSLRFGLRRIPSLLWLLLLMTILLAIAFLALIIPSIWLAIAWSLAIPALLAEDLRGRKALGRSFRLVRGRWWQVLGTLAIGVILAYIVVLVFTFLVGLVVFVGSADSVVLAVLLNTVGSAIAAILTTPFLAALYAILYYDLRVRREGFDIELQAAGLGDSGGGALAAPPPTETSGPPPPPAPGTSGPPPPPPPSRASG